MSLLTCCVTFHKGRDLLVHPARIATRMKQSRIEYTASTQLLISERCARCMLRVEPDPWH